MVQPAITLKRSGDIIKSDGAGFQEGDWLQFQQSYSLPYETVNNGPVEITYRDTDLAEAATHYYGLSVPAGRIFVLYLRELTVTEGKYHVDVITAANGFTGGTTAHKTTLRTSATSTVSSDLKSGVTPDGAITVQSTGLIDTGSQKGSAVSSEATSQESVFKMFCEECGYMLRVTRVSGTGTWDANIRLIAWEVAA